MTDETTPITETPATETPVVETPTPETTPGTLATETPVETPAASPTNAPGVAVTPKAAAAGPIGNAEFHDSQVGTDGALGLYAKATNEVTKIVDAIKADAHRLVAGFEHDEEVTVADIKKLIERVTGDHTAVKGEDTTTVVKSPTA